MNYVLILIGAVLSFFSYRWSFYYMCNPNYFRLKGRSELTQLWLETAFNIIFFGGYGLIIFSCGFRLYRIIINIVIVIILHLFIFPILGRMRIRSDTYKSNDSDAWNGNIMVDNYISPNYTWEKLENPNFDDLLEVFEDRVRNWLLKPTESLLKLPQGFVAAISLLFTYFESIQIYIYLAKIAKVLLQIFSLLVFLQYLVHLV